MKRKWLNAVSTLALAFVMLLLPIFSTVDGSKQTKDYVDYTTQTRTINADESIIDFESIFNEYEDAKIETDGSLTTFEGRQVLNLADLDELDEVSKQELEGEQLNIKYKYSFDYVTDKVTLTAVSIIDTEDGEIQEEIIDTVEGTAFINEAGNIDAVLNIDGEEYLLSELQDAGMVENCGLFKKIFKAIKKVTKTVVGVVGAIATVAVPAVIGVVGAMTGLGLVATIAIGAVAGATIATATSAASTAQQNNGKVDWKTVGVCAGVGAVVGFVVSGAAYGITKAVQAAKAAKSAKAAEEAAKAAESATKLPSTKIETSKLQHEWKHAKDFGIDGNWNKTNGQKYKAAIENHIKNSTEVYKSTYRGNDVYVYLDGKTNIGAYVDMSGNYIGGWKFSADQIAFHIKNGIKIILKWGNVWEVI